MPRPQFQPPQDAPRVAPSKTRRKLEMHELQDLGIALVALDSSRLASLDLPEKLVDAITLARTVTRHEARRRQMQFIGRLMREIDADPVRAALARWADGPQRDRARFALVERWRDRVLDEPGGLQAFADAYPSTAPGALGELIAEVRAERARGAPPRKSRALFRELKRIVDDATV